MVKRGHLYGPQASEREAQHGPFCWIGRVGQGDEPRCEKHANSLRLSLIVALIAIDASYTRPTIIQPPSPVYACRRLFKGRGGPRLMMTELEFLTDFNANPMAFGPAQNLSMLKVQVDRLSSAKGRALSQELCLWGSISPRNSIRWPRSMDLLSLTGGMTAAKLPRHRPRCGAMSEITNTFNAAKISDGDVKGSSVEISIRRFCGSLARRLHPWRKTRADRTTGCSHQRVCSNRLANPASDKSHHQTRQV